MKTWPTVAIPDLLCATLAIAGVVGVIVYAGYLVIGRRIVTLHRLDLPRSALGAAVLSAHALIRVWRGGRAQRHESIQFACHCERRRDYGG